MTPWTASPCPRTRSRVLLLEGVNDSAVDLFKARRLHQPDAPAKALDGEAAERRPLQGVHLLGIRSRTQLTGEVVWRRRTG